MASFPDSGILRATAARFWIANKLSFTTENVHGTWFTFEGVLGHGSGKKPEDEAYYVARGTLTRFSTDAEKKVTSQARQVEFKSFPRDAAPN